MPLQVYTGDGKGKTTAALGLSLRAAGAGLRVYIGQFIKTRPTSEVQAITRHLPGVTVEQYGAGGFVKGQPSPEDLEAARQGLHMLRAALSSGEYDMVIADEACSAAQAGCLTEEDLLSLAAARPERVELVITGRSAPAALVELADLVTEMHKVKHYFDTGLQARKGIEH